jgi:hypothetical protein
MATRKRIRPVAGAGGGAPEAGEKESNAMTGVVELPHCRVVAEGEALQAWEAQERAEWWDAWIDDQEAQR